MRTVRPTVLSSFVAFLRWSGAMKRSKFTVREGLVMLLGVALVLIVMLWLRRIKIDFAFSAEPSPGVRFLHHEEDR
jgi:hypothetical protein